MVLTLELKYYIVLIFLYLTNNTKSMLTFAGKTHKIQSLRVSNAQENVALHWPKGIVAYYFDNLTYDNYIAQRVSRAMDVLETASCVKFKLTTVKPVGNMTWIHFTNPQEERKCVHEPQFKEDGEITLVLGFECLKEHEILHTLLHAIGFKDEVTHPQRDQYIRVMWNNIQPEFRYLYRIRPSDEKTSQLLGEYDPLSIMHFHDRAFSMNGQATVMPLVPGLLISPSDDLSQLDKMRLRLLFDHECNKRKVGDMIDTCKMLLTTNDGSNDGQNETQSESGQVDETEVSKDEDVDVSISVAYGDSENKADVTPDIDDQISNETQNGSAGQRPDNVTDVKLQQTAILPDLYGFGLG